MWRNWTTHQHKETMFLSEIKDVILDDNQIEKQITEVLDKVRVDKIMARLFSTLPLENFRLRLGFLYAVVGAKIHLADIEEIKRNKVFFGEIDETEETMKEKVASLEVFILAHELGKLETNRFYAHQIVKKEYRGVLSKLADKFRLTPDDIEDVFHLIILHEKAVEDFSRGPVKATYEYLEKYCQKYGRDADDFLDLLLSAVFLSTVIDAELLSKVFFNFLSAERQHAPERNVARLNRQTERNKKNEQARWREVGLDGKDLMKLLEMKSGPEFGKLLVAIQVFAKGEGEMPKVSVEVETELLSRIQKFVIKPPPQAPSPKAGRGLVEDVL